jgi:hypothetical protein
MQKERTRTKEERRIETNSIIKSLNDLKINTGYSEVRELYKCIQSYVNDGIRQEIDIPFPAISRRIKGVLALNKKEKVWVKLEYFELYPDNTQDN